MVFVKSDIPSSRLNYFKIPSDTLLYLLIALIYNAPSQKNKYFFWYLTNLLEFYSTWYEKVIILGHFNIEAQNIVMKDFL